MSSWKNRLQEADAALASDLTPEQARALRQKIVAEAATILGSRVWSLPFALTAGSLAAAAAALVFSTIIAAPQTATPVSRDFPAEQSEIAPDPGGTRQQLHFATPGGTRIIWVFDAQFEVKGTLP